MRVIIKERVIVTPKFDVGRSPKIVMLTFLQTQANLKLFAVKTKGENYKQEQTIILREFPKTLRNGVIHKFIDELEYILFSLWFNGHLTT